MSYEEEKQDRKIEQLEAEIERLRAENASLSKAVIDIQEERDLAQAEFRAYHEAWEERAARIQGLEALLSFFPKDLAAAQLTTEGKIGADAEAAHHECQECSEEFCDEDECPRDHIGGPNKLIWQITDERKAAITHMVNVGCPYGDCRATVVLRAMLKEVGQ